MLAVDAVTVRFGGLYAVQQMSLTITERSIHALIGPNGAGKTTLFNVVTRMQAAEHGSVSFLGAPLDGLSADRLIERGIARTFQNLQLFQGMTVYENIASGLVHSYRQPIAALLLGRHLGFARKLKDRVAETAELFGLTRMLPYFPSQLSYGVLKRVEMARALISRPKLLLLDEPVAGLNDDETEEISTILRRLNREGITIFLVEHDMKLVMDISDRVTVMNFGRLIAEGPPEAIARHPEVIRVYLGGGSHG